MSANGRLLDSELEVVEDNDRLKHSTANAFRRARAAYYAEGHSGSCIVEPAGAYRDWNVQYNMKHGIPSFAYWNLNPNSKAGLANPGQSTHGLGDSLDAASGFQAFLLRRGREFGFFRPYGDNDPNHWRHNGTTATGAIGSALPGEIDRALLRRQKEETMYVHSLTAPSTIYNVFTDANGQPRLRWCGPNEAAAAIAGGLSIPCDAGTINAMGEEMGYKSSNPRAVLKPEVEATVDVGEGTVPPLDLSPVMAAIAAVPAAVVAEQKLPGN